jgi:hypothetical protein
MTTLTPTVLELTTMKSNHVLLAMTFASVFLFGTSLFAQQEVDPTWYDPWGAPNQVASHPTAPTHVAKTEHHARIEAGVSKLRAEKLRASDSLVIRPGHRRPEPLQTATSQEMDLGMPSRGYLSSILVAHVPY